MSLRKKKTHEIINAKRRKLIGIYEEENNQGQEHVHTSYRGFTQFEKNPEEFEKQLKELCPEIFNEGVSIPLVRSIFTLK